MKKLVMILALLILLSGTAFAAKDTTYTSVSDVSISLTFNVPKYEEGIWYYIPVFAQMNGRVLTTDGGSKGVYLTKEIGTVSETPATNGAIKKLIKTPALKELYTEWYAEALNEVVVEDE